jgi:cytochrome P450
MYTQYSCLGDRFVTLEVALFLRALLQRYDVAQVSAEAKPFYTPMFLRFKQNLPLKFTPRKDASKL